MTHRKTSTEVPYAAEDMFALVADIEHYPEFLKWCPALRIVENNSHDGIGDIIADVVIAYKIFREQFRSRVILDRSEKIIQVGFISGPFRTLETDWRFEDLTGGGSIVHFDIEFELNSIILQTAAHTFFERKFSRMSEAFIARADEVYGAKAPS